MSAIETAFRDRVEKQAADRDQPLNSFNREVARSVMEGGLAALRDRCDGIARYQVVSAPTGSGKSSYAWAFIAAVVDADPNSSALFLCETVDQCEDTFHELAKLVPPTDLAVWTKAHDLGRSAEDIRRERGFVPPARFHAADLSSYRVVIVTHAFYKGNRGGLARHYLGEPRSLTVMDERPKEVAVFDVDQGDVGKVRDWAVGRFGDASEAVAAIKSLHDFLGEAWELKRGEEGKDYRALRKSDLTWFHSREAETVVVEGGIPLPAIVIGFARALATGYAFMARYDGSTRGGRFVGYRMDLPILPGTVLLDATSDIDGVSSIASWRVAVPSPKVSYDNLEVTLLAPPTSIVGSRERVSEIVKTAKRAGPYAKWIKETVAANTAPGEKVLVVVHKGLLDHAYLPDQDSLGEDSFDLMGRKVAFINWGYGIGSNRWKEATSVFLFGEFHVPKRTTMATTLGLLDQPAETPRLDRMGGPNSQDDLLRTVMHGHLLRWEKQLAMRGNARNLSPEGVCGRQRLFVTSEFGRFVQYRDALFPGATFVVDESVHRALPDSGGTKALAALLATTDTSRLTSRELREAGITTKHISRMLAHNLVVAVMSSGGWRYVRGGGRGRSSYFERSSPLSTINDNLQPAKTRAA